MREAGGFPLVGNKTGPTPTAPSLPTNWRDLSDLVAVLAAEQPASRHANDESEAGEPQVAEEVRKTRCDNHCLPFFTLR